MDASNTQTRWGMIAIDDSQESVGLTLAQSCQELASQHALTKRETEIAEQLVRGRDRHAIAERLFISEGTVKVHTCNIYQKLGIHSKQELIAMVEKIEESFKE
jgi:DNA-binding NarL/FixJ family response regulator